VLITTATSTTATATTVTATTTTATSTTTTNTIYQHLQGRMSGVETTMEDQIQTLLTRVAALSADNAALRALHAAAEKEKEAVAANSNGADDGNDGPHVAVDPTTNTLNVRAAVGNAVQVAPTLSVGQLYIFLSRGFDSCSIQV
jgi:hypothetical protein